MCAVGSPSHLDVRVGGIGPWDRAEAGPGVREASLPSKTASGARKLGEYESKSHPKFEQTFVHRTSSNNSITTNLLRIEHYS